MPTKEELRRAAAVIEECRKGQAVQIERGVPIPTRKYERRDVECFYERDFENDIVVTMRVDNYQVVEKRRMTPEERQAFLPMVDDTLRKLEKPGDGDGQQKG